MESNRKICVYISKLNSGKTSNHVSRFNTGFEEEVVRKIILNSYQIEREHMDWIPIAQDRDQLWSSVNKLTNLGVP